MVHLMNSYLLEQISQDIVEVGPNHQRKQQEHTYHLSAFHKGIARFAAGNDFIKQEEYMSTNPGQE